MAEKVICPVMAAMALPQHATAADPSLSSLCLDLCRHLSSQGKEFNFSLSVDKFSFYMDSKEEAQKKSGFAPSNIKSTTEKEEKKFKCHSCGYTIASKVDMEEHIKKVHKTASIKQ